MQKKKTYALFSLVCAVFGTTFLAIRIGLLGGASPFLASGLRFIVAGGILTAILAARKKISIAFVRKRWRNIAILSLFQTVLTFGGMYIAETRMDSGYMARLDSLGPICTAIFALVILRKGLKGGHVVGFILGTAGSFLLAGEVRGANFDAGALAAAFVGTISYAMGMVLYDRFYGPDDDPIAINAIQMLLGGIILTLASPILETPAFPVNHATIGSLLYLAVVGSIVAHSANFMVIRDAGAVFASAWLYVSPILASLTGFLALGERVNAHGLAGTALAMIGVFAINTAENAADRRAPGSHVTEK